MRKKITMQRKFLSLVQVGLLVTTGLWLPSSVPASEDEVDVIVNKSNAVSSISLNDVRKIFTCEKSVWPGSGKRITVLMLVPGQPERLMVLREIYKMRELDYTKYFLEAIFTGRLSEPPKEVNSPAQMKQYLTSHVGAVGYLKKQDVDDTVKVVLRVP
jgi:hypothetical protein